MNRKEIVNALVDAITASGKKFAEISKDSIYGFLKREGIEEKHWNSIYDDLEEIYIPTSKKKKQNPNQGHIGMSQTGSHTHVDYSDSSHNDVKVRQPRKSVFSDIKKIAG